MKGRGREYDGYAVGRRLLRLAPVWLLLTLLVFVLALLLFRWVGRRSGASGDEALRNEATNQQSATPEGGHAATSPPKPSPVAEASPAATAELHDELKEELKEEAGSYSVQVGAYVELSQANEQVSRLRAAGFEARVIESDAATHFRFQVRSGRYATREEAARLATDLRARSVAGETVIVEPEQK